MSASRIEQAMARINAAMSRIDGARAQIEEAPPAPPENSQSDTGSSEKVMALVNAHEKLREEVAETIGQIDTLIDELEA